SRGIRAGAGSPPLRHRPSGPDVAGAAGGGVLLRQWGDRGGGPHLSDRDAGAGDRHCRRATHRTDRAALPAGGSLGAGPRLRAGADREPPGLGEGDEAAGIRDAPGLHHQGTIAMGLSSKKTKTTSNQTATTTPNVPAYAQQPAQDYYKQVGQLGSNLLNNLDPYRTPTNAVQQA